MHSPHPGRHVIMSLLAKRFHSSIHIFNFRSVSYIGLIQFVMYILLAHGHSFVVTAALQQ